MPVNARFIHNLSQDTFRFLDEGILLAAGYLLAPNNATRALKSFAEQVLKKQVDLLADNGNFVEIGKIKNRFKEESAKLLSQVRKIERETLGRSARPGDLPLQLQNQYRLFSKRVGDACKVALLDDADMLIAQQDLNPTALIGTEDITMASWLSLDIEDAYTHARRSTYRSINRKTARRAIRIMSNLPYKLRHHYYPVASAVSYNTAVDAGREFATNGIRNISMGFGAYTADSNYGDHILINKKLVDFGDALPSRYTRTIAVVKGFWTGYQEVLGKPPLRFHFLGLGAPILLPLVTLSAQATSNLTFDATSPIKDATTGGTLYVNKPALLKVRIRKVALKLASSIGRKWDCPCPFCKKFTQKYPFHYGMGQQWYIQNNPASVEANDLRPGGGLYNAYPLLSEPKSGTELRSEVNFCRIGHNHWIIEQILAGLRQADQQKILDKYVTDTINEYIKNTSPPFAKAIDFSLKLVQDKLIS